jgi:hypothetical protein
MPDNLCGVTAVHHDRTDGTDHRLRTDRRPRT